MALTAAEQEFLDWAKRSLPPWFDDENRPAEFLGLAAKVMGSAKTITEFWKSQAFILTAVGPVRTNDYSLRLAAGTGHWVEISDGSQTGLDLTTFTIRGWVQLDSLGTARTLIAKSDAAPQTDLSYLLGIESSEELVLILSPDGTLGSAVFGTSAVGAITDNVWHHIAVTYDEATGDIVFYVDGNVFDTASVAATTPFDGAADFSIGNIEDGSLADFDGSVDEIVIWSVVKTDEEILADMFETSPDTTGLVAHWRFENNLNDSSASGNALIGQGGAPNFVLGNLPFTQIIEPDWLNQHARDRGTRRQIGETDPALRDRLRNTPEALTRSSILDAINSILQAEGLADPANMVELKRDRAFFGDFTSDADATSGGEFELVTGTTFKFTPAVPFAKPMEVGFPRSGNQGNPRITFSGSTSAGNDGTFEVTALDGDAVIYVNATGVAEVDAATDWVLSKHDVEGNIRDGFKRAYFSRGYRMGRHKPPTIIPILPFGCDAGTLNSVNEMLRQKKGAGVIARAECMDGLNWPLTSAALKSALFPISAPAGDFDSIYQPSESSGPIDDHVGTDPLTPTTGGDAPDGQGVISKVLGSRVLRFGDGTDQAAEAAAGTVHDVTTNAFGLLVGFRVLDISGAVKNIVGKADAGPDLGYALKLTSTNQLRFQIDDNSVVQGDAVVIPPAGHNWDDGDFHLAYATRNVTAVTLDLITTLGDASIADISGDISNTSLFTLGEGPFALQAPGVEIAYVAVVTTATLSEAINKVALSNFRLYLLRAGLR